MDTFSYSPGDFIAIFKHIYFLGCFCNYDDCFNNINYIITIEGRKISIFSHKEIQINWQQILIPHHTANFKHALRWDTLSFLGKKSYGKTHEKYQNFVL